MLKVKAAGAKKQAHVAADAKKLPGKLASAERSRGTTQSTGPPPTVTGTEASAAGGDNSSDRRCGHRGAGGGGGGHSELR